MPHANIFRWRDGAGWLVLSGGGAPGNEIEALALTRLPPGDPVAYIWAADTIESADLHLAALDEAGAPTGYLVDVQTEDDDTLREQLAQAGLIILGDGPNIGDLRGGLAGAALDGMSQAYARGAVILAIGAGAAVLAQKYLVDGTLRAGFSWLEKAILVPDYKLERNADHDSEQAEQLRAALIQLPDSFGLGISSDSALALGPAGQVETWGAHTLSVTLGTTYIQGET